MRVRRGLILLFVSVGAVLSIASPAQAASSAETNSVIEPPPETPREFFNAGTRRLNEGKLREAEAFLETALTSQRELWQPGALYNLGHVRFAQGLEELKKAPSSGEALGRGETASDWGKHAIKEADDALESNVVKQMVMAYLRGRGVRKGLKAATEAVRQALDAHSAALLKWQRASGDFRSAYELAPDNAAARENGDIVDRHIARLVDSIRQLQQMAAMLGKERDTLKEKLRQLRGRIPEEEMPPGAAGDDEEDDPPPEPQAGQQEAPTKPGIEIELTPEQAGWLLEGFRLDRERRLPMGQDQQTPPRDRNRPDW